MGAPKGNQYWRLREDMTEDGRKISIKDLIERLQSYIDRCVNETLKEQQIHKRKISRDEEVIEKLDCDKKIAMSIWGACVWLDIADVTWLEWRKDEKYSSILTHAETIFKAWNVEGSAAGLLNQSIIARIEGLRENTDITTGGKTISNSPSKTIIEFHDYTKKDNESENAENRNTDE